MSVRMLDYISVHIFLYRLFSNNVSLTLTDQDEAHDAAGYVARDDVCLLHERKKFISVSSNRTVRRHLTSIIVSVFTRDVLRLVWPFDGLVQNLVTTKICSSNHFLMISSTA